MAKTLLFGGVLGQFHPCEHEQQALWLGLATGGVQECPEFGAAHAACVMVIGAQLERPTQEVGRAHVSPRSWMGRCGDGRGAPACAWMTHPRNRLLLGSALPTT